MPDTIYAAWMFWHELSWVGTYESYDDAMWHANQAAESVYGGATRWSIPEHGVEVYQVAIPMKKEYY